VPNIIVIGASAGGIDPLRTILRPLPADFQAALFVVMHLSPLSPSVLPVILQRDTALTVMSAENGIPIEPGCVYVAPPDRHMLVEPGSVRLTRGPKENRHRPAIDVLFRTAARAYGSRVLGIVLTGLMGDGTAGIRVIKSEGGVAIVQDPEDAAFSMMPESALNTGVVDLVLAARDIAAKIKELVNESWEQTEGLQAQQVRWESPTAEGEKMSEEQDERLMGRPSQFTCPDCSGTLWEIQDGDILRFRCRVGHAYSGDGMRAGCSESVEGALWSAVRSLEESASLEEKLADMADHRGDRLSAENFRQVARDRQEQAAVIRSMLLSNDKSDEIIAP
jgi:two-component system chemotaxis response regulator CheB